MAKKKSTPKKSVEEPLMEKIAGTLGNITGELIVAKNRLVEMAGGAIDSVKETLHNVTAKKPVAKKAVKAVAKKAVKAVSKKVEKETAPAKKAIKKAAKKIAPVKKAVKKVIKKAAKKVSPAKKAVKKAAKKIAADSRSLRRL